MNAEQAALWERISRFPLDVPGASFPYSAKLSRENRWSPEFAARVIEEYRRFAFLSVAAGHMVSPSDAVDQAWHVHLLYTQSYWGEFCTGVLGKPLHHSPSQGGSRESRKFDSAYTETLASYERLFGSAPPFDIWPSPEVRRRERHSYIRVDRVTHWTLPKIKPKVAAPYVAVGLLALALLGCGSETGSLNPFDLDGPGFLVFYLCLMAVCFTVAAVARYFVRLPGPSDLASMENLTPLEAACLAGDSVGSLRATIGALVVCGYVKVHPVQQSVETINPDSTGLDPLAAHVVSDCNVPGGLPLHKLRLATILSIQAIHDRLVQRQLMPSPGDRLRAALLVAFLAGLPLWLAIPRMIIGAGRGHPIGYLFGLSVLTLFVAIGFLAAAPKRTLRGDAVLSKQRATRASIRAARSQWQPTMPEATLAIGLFGLAVIPDDYRQDVNHLLAPSTSGSGSGADGGGCGSSGCSGGGGCGGGCGG
ncbi:MAG TPA: TIGR04222 domain-containing membrane protein [Fimbriimonadaceae bacterium]|nr:TIGR04222 domain-containing membrane protein [Fimbriimonadaceae bacterium]